MAHSTISQRLHDRLGQIIATTTPGDRLPSEPDLAQSLGVSRATLREAMRTFETQGLIRRRQGSGTFVSHPSAVIDTGLEVLESIETMGERFGLKATLGELKLQVRPPSEEERAALLLPPGAEVTQVSRVILAEDHPVAFLTDILQAGLLTLDELTEKFSGSVLDLLLSRGEPRLWSSRTEINAVAASSAVARALGIQRGDVLLRFIATLYSLDGAVVDYSYSYFLPGYFRFHVVRRVGGSSTP
jgi:GntR family transcriptional regulator